MSWFIRRQPHPTAWAVVTFRAVAKADGGELVTGPVCLTERECRAWIVRHYDGGRRLPAKLFGVRCPVALA
jgi:hypothetical protein